MPLLIQSWLTWAVLSAGFAALTAIFAKIGVAGVDSDLATFLRTLVVAALLGLLVVLTGKWQNPVTLPARTLVFLGLSGAATGASWLCYFRALQIGDVARVAPVDKLSVVFVAVFAVLFLGERLSVTNWFGLLMMAGGAILLAQRG